LVILFERFTRYWPFGVDPPAMLRAWGGNDLLRAFRAMEARSNLGPADDAPAT
jgi:hypothetical protein